MIFFTPFTLLLALAATLVGVKGYYQSASKKNSFGLTPSLFPLGIFVWGDAITIAPFWLLTSLISAATQDVDLFFTLVALFWTVRAYGEVQYWIAEQFAQTHRNKPKDLLGHQLFSEEAVWFGYQTFWQCIMVFAGVATIAFANLWITK